MHIGLTCNVESAVNLSRHNKLGLITDFDTPSVSTKPVNVKGQHPEEQ